MAKMRATQHNSRANSAGRVHGSKHNDRDFDTEQAENIDQQMSQENVYWHLYQNQYPEMTFTEAELKFYTETFGEQLQKTNDNYLRQSHPERCKDMATWKMARQNAPEETVLQIGKVEGHADAATLMNCFQEYQQRLEQWNQDHGKPFTTLSYALHVDEAVPHIQSRRVWHYEDAKGQIRIGQEKALAKAGVELPDPNWNETRRNNRKVTFDKMAREMWLDVLHEHGLDIEREPVPDGKHNREKEDMIRDKYEALLDETERLRTENKELKAEIEPLRELKTSLDEVTAASSPLPGGFVMVKKQKWETIEEQARAYRANAPEIEDIRERAGKVRAMELDVSYYLKQAATRLEQADAIYAKQKDLNKRYMELDNKNRELTKQLTESTKECKLLRAENASLRDEVTSIPRKIEEATAPLREQLEAVKAQLRGAYESLTAAVKAIVLFKYDDMADGYRLRELPSKAGKLIDAIAAYGAKWARADGFPDLAHDMEKKMGISKGIQAMIEPEPKQKSQKKDDLVL